jgi:sarcosine oxidase gamma subunit
VRELLKVTVDGESRSVTTVARLNAAARQAPQVARLALRGGQGVHERVSLRSQRQQLVAQIAASTIELLTGPDRVRLRGARGRAAVCCSSPGTFIAAGATRARLATAFASAATAASHRRSYDHH